MKLSNYIKESIVNDQLSKHEDFAKYVIQKCSINTHIHLTQHVTSDILLKYNGYEMTNVVFKNGWYTMDFKITDEGLKEKQKQLASTINYKIKFEIDWMVRSVENDFKRKLDFVMFKKALDYKHRVTRERRTKKNIIRKANYRYKYYFRHAFLF